MMFDIDALKEMKLLELQEIAQKIDVPKYRKYIWLFAFLLTESRIPIV